MLEGDRMKYLEQSLDISVRYREWDYIDSLPQFLLMRYRFQVAYLDGVQTLFIYPQYEIEDINELKNHIQVINKFENIPVVMIVQKLTLRKRNSLIKLRIPFIVENKHIYLPFLAIVMQERCDKEKTQVENMSAITQVIFLYLLYLNSDKVYMSDLNKKLNIHPMSISRAIMQLENSNLIKTYKEKVHKVIVLEDKGKTLFEKGLKYLSSPVKQSLYVYKKDIHEDLLCSGYSALSQLTMLSPTHLMTYACNDIGKYQHDATDILVDQNEQVEIQEWKYDPTLLSQDNVVDILSLYLNFYHNHDERVEKEFETLLNNLWRSMNG